MSILEGGERKESGMSYKSDLKQMCRIFIGKEVIILVIALIRLARAACLATYLKPNIKSQK